MGQVIEGHEGNPIGADEQHRMKVYATIFSEDHFAAVNGDTYTMDIDGITTDAANYWLAVIKNTNDHDLIVTSVTLWLAAYTADAHIEAYLGGTLAYTANGTAVVPANLRSGVSGGAEGEFYVNDGAGNIATIVAGSIAGRFIFTNTPTKWIKGSGWVVPKNQTFMLQSAKDGEVFKGYISFYYRK